MWNLILDQTISDIPVVILEELLSLGHQVLEIGVIYVIIKNVQVWKVQHLACYTNAEIETQWACIKCGVQNISVSLFESSMFSINSSSNLGEGMLSVNSKPLRVVTVKFNTADILPAIYTSYRSYRANDKGQLIKIKKLW